MSADDAGYYPRRGADPRDVVEELARGWRLAAERAFSGRLQEPGAYQVTTRLVGALLEELRGGESGFTGLLERWERREEGLRRAAAAHGITDLTTVDGEAVAGAAFALRFREVVEEVTVAERKLAIDRSAADTWVVVEESGPPSGDPFVAYRRLEVHTGTGRALLVSTRPDETLMGCVHNVTVGRVDLASGRLLPLEDPDAASHDLPDSDQREALVAELRSRPDDQR